MVVAPFVFQWVMTTPPFLFIASCVAPTAFDIQLQDRRVMGKPVAGGHPTLIGSRRDYSSRSRPACASSPHSCAIAIGAATSFPVVASAQFQQTLVPARGVGSG